MTTPMTFEEQMHKAKLRHGWDKQWTIGQIFEAGYYEGSVWARETTIAELSFVREYLESIRDNRCYDCTCERESVEALSRLDALTGDGV